MPDPARRSSASRRWPLDIGDVFWWSTITVALAGYLGLRRRHLQVVIDAPALPERR